METLGSENNSFSDWRKTSWNIPLVLVTAIRGRAEMGKANNSHLENLHFFSFSDGFLVKHELFLKVNLLDLFLANGLIQGVGDHEDA